MKLRNAVLTSAAVIMASTAAMAQTQTPMPMDITSPFYLPTEGKMFSETSMEYTRFKEDKRAGGYVDEEMVAKTKLSYGVTDNVSVFATVANYFDVQGDYNNDHNFTYSVGTAYNHKCGNVLSQFGLEYRTWEEDDFEGHSFDRTENLNKDVILNAKFGYEMASGLVPYVDVAATYALNRTEGNEVTPFYTDSEEQSRWEYSTFAGAHKMFEKSSMDLGVRWINDRDEHKSKDSVLAEGEYNYFLSDDMSVGVYGAYLIGDSEMGDVDYGYNVGANFKVAF